MTTESRPVNSREVARRVLDRIAGDGAWATPALDGELARVGLDDRDRRLASELVYGVLRHRARIDRAISAHAELDRTPPMIVTILRVAAYQILMLDRVPGYAAVDDAVDAANVVGAKLGGFVNAVLRKLTANGEAPFPAVANDSMDAHLARFEIEHSTPRWILDELAAATRDEVRAMVDERARIDASDRASSAGGDSVDPGRNPGGTSVDRASTDAFMAARSVRIGELAAAFAHSAPLVARVNSRRATRDEVIAELASTGVTATPIASAPMALRLEGLGDPSRDKGFMAGRWTVQDTGAQHVGLVAASALGATTSPVSSPSLASPASWASPSLDAASLVSPASPSLDAASLSLDAASPSLDAASPSLDGASPSLDAASPSLDAASSASPAMDAVDVVLHVLDACAGVGGKSAHLAELLGDRARIDAADINATKLSLGQEAAQRLGVTSITTHACDLLDPAAPLRRDYDLIVLDAPCTGLGVLRRHPDAKWRLKQSDVKRLAELQRMLLDAVVPRLKAGGTLVYSVCTFTRAEGPEQIAALVKRTGLELVEQERTWPPDADAFYLARLRSRP